MEHPIFSHNKAIDTRVLRYERNNVLIEVSPSVKGLATIYDKDILLSKNSRILYASIFKGRDLNIFAKSEFFFSNAGSIFF